MQKTVALRAAFLFSAVSAIFALTASQGAAFSPPKLAAGFEDGSRDSALVLIRKGGKHVAHKRSKVNAKHKKSNVDLKNKKKTNVDVKKKKNTNVDIKKKKNTNIDINNRKNTNVNVRVVNRSYGWRGQYWGAVAFGITLGAIITVAANTPPLPPDPTLCWTWTNSAHTRGYWYYCSGP